MSSSAMREELLDAALESLVGRAEGGPWIRERIAASHWLLVDDVAAGDGEDGVVCDGMWVGRVRDMERDIGD